MSQPPVGMFRAVAKERDGTENEQLSVDLIFELSKDRLSAGGFEFIDHNGQRVYWGVQIDITGETITAKTYKFARLGRIGGFYNPKRPDSSWAPKEHDPEGEITLIEVDHGKKFAHGTFKFEVFSRHNPEQSAEITGSFSLTAGAKL